jgi:hypothetical protein
MTTQPPQVEEQRFNRWFEELEKAAQINLSGIRELLRKPVSQIQRELSDAHSKIGLLSETISRGERERSELHASVTKAVELAPCVLSLILLSASN